MSAEPSLPTYRAGDPVRDGVPDHGRVPRYYTVKTELLALIARLGVGAALPPEREIAERAGVSRMTVRQAVAELVLEGRLRRRPGAGTYVSPPKLVQQLALVATTGRRGSEPTRAPVTVEHLPASAAVAADLAVRPGAMVVHLERVLLADDERVGLESIYLPAARFPGLTDRYDPATPLYAHLGARYGVVPAEAEERLETVLATPREALLIGTNPALPMLLLNRLSADADGVPVERARALYRGDRFAFTTRLRA